MSDAHHEPPLTGAETQPLEYLVVQTGGQVESAQKTSTQEYRAAIDSLFEHSMTEDEADFFRREMASKIVPLTSEQTRCLPPRMK